MTGAKARLLAAALLFVGWLAYLGYAAVSKSRGPVVSRAQAAAAAVVVFAAIKGDNAPAGTAAVTANLKDGPAVGTELDVVNLADASGWAGAGEYLLLLERTAAGDKFRVVGQQRSPGYELGGVGKPTIYRRSADVEAQAAKLLP
jgi:hypothetical protein